MMLYGEGMDENGYEGNNEESTENKIKTGISGLDQMLYGGIEKNSQVLIAGGPGTGKTLMTFEILYNCAKSGINSAFIALEESAKQVIKNAKSAFPDFTDIDELIKSKRLIVDGEDPSLKVQQATDSESYAFGGIVADIENVILSNGSKVVAIDSVSILRLVLETESAYRKAMLALVSNLKRLGVTSILVSEVSSSDRRDVKFTPEFFIFDSVIVMYPQSDENKRLLELEIIKSRGSNHSWALAPYEITPNGFRIFTIES